MYRWLDESIAGTRHRAAGAVNQDARDVTLTVRSDGARVLVAAVADGAGSAPLGDVGASVATIAFRESVCAHLASGHAFSTVDLRRAVARARTCVIEEATRRHVTARDLSCTLLVAVVGPDAAFFGQIGDGAIVAGGSARGERIFPAEPGEYANVTHFLSSLAWREHLRVVQVAPPAWFAMCTDGIELLSIDPRSDRPLDGFFAPFVQAVATAEDVSDLVVPLRQFLDSPRVNAHTDDDKTLLVAVRKLG